MPRGIYDRSKAKARREKEAKAQEKVRLEPKPEKPRKPSPTIVSLSLQLGSLSGESEIKLRDSKGTLLGTLLFDEGGIQYKRPNQKAPATRKLSWSTLDKLMAIGLQ